LGRWDAAAEWLGAAAALDPTQLLYQVEYGWALFQATGELSQAVAIEESVLESNPGAVDVILILADIYLQAERPQKGLEWSETAVAAAPADPETWLRLARAYWMLEQGADAQQALVEVLRLDPENSQALTWQREWESP
jgi:cytochrome c-type biogenesis protein CcmH/NrfG